jgi:hypothetical protein
MPLPVRVPGNLGPEACPLRRRVSRNGHCNGRVNMYDPDEDTGPASDDPAELQPVPDLSGIAVEDASGVPVGELFGALVEADTGLVRYLDLDLARTDRHVLVPIGHARVREHERDGTRFRLRAALVEDLEQIPPFPADVRKVDDPFERELLEAYGRTFHGERYYAHPAYDHTGVFTGERPVRGADAKPAGHDAGHATDGSPPLRRLAYLPGWRVAQGEQDVRRWAVRLEDGTGFRARDLMVDTDAEKVRYVVVTSDDGNVSRLLPIGFLQVDAARQQVHAPGLTRDDLVALPPYDGGGLSREQEDRLCRTLRQRLRGRRRYALPDFRRPPDSKFP